MRELLGAGVPPATYAWAVFVDEQAGSDDGHQPGGAAAAAAAAAADADDAEEEDEAGAERRVVLRDRCPLDVLLRMEDWSTCHPGGQLSRMSAGEPWTPPAVE